MSYYIARDRQQFGKYSEEEIRYGLAEGKFFGSDLGWQSGMEEWRPLDELIAPSDVPLPPRAPKEVVDVYIGKPIYEEKKTSGEGISGFAMIAMLMGLLSLMVYGLFCETKLAAEFFDRVDDLKQVMIYGYIGAYAYIMIFGHHALAQIKKSKGKLRGKSMAMSGIFMGYFLFVLLTPTTVAMALPPAAVEENSVPALNVDLVARKLSESKAQTLIDACILYASRNGGGFPDNLEKLVDEKYLSDRQLLTDPLSQGHTRANFEYLAEGMKENDPQEAIVLRSQAQKNGARVIARKDGSVTCSLPPFR